MVGTSNLGSWVMAIDLLSAGSAKFETAKGPTEII